MILRSRPSVRPLPPEFLSWQVKLRAHTMEERGGAPHAGVAPLLTLHRPGFALGVSTHSIICGLLPHPDRLEAKTREFRELYRNHAEAGAKTLYDHGIAYLRTYYQDPETFDPDSVTTLVSLESPILAPLTADPRCQLLFYVFDLDDRTEIGRSRCLLLECRAEVHRDGPVFDNVWWHNALFHGQAADSAVLRFRHQKTFDTQFGSLEEVG